MWNWIDIAQYVSFPAMMIMMKYIRSDAGSDGFWNEKNINYNSIVTIFMFMGFFRSITMLNFWDETRWLIAMIVETFKDMRSFFTILVFSIYLFALIHIEFSKTSTFEDPTKQHYELSETLDLMFNWSFGNWADSSQMNRAEYIGFLGFTVFLPLVMMNLFIALIWETFGNIQGNREVADYRQILDILEDFNLFTSMFTGKSTKKTKKYLHLILEDKSGDDEEEDGNRKMENIMDSQEMILESLEKMENRQIGLEEKLEVIERREGAHKKVIGAIRASTELNVKLSDAKLENYQINW